MSQFNSFAQELDTVFKTAREEYTAAYTALEQAQKAEQDAKINGSDTKKQIAALTSKEASATFAKERERIFAEFDAQCDALSRKLAQEVNASNRANPEAVDNNAVLLMQTGLLSADDYYGFAERFDGNATMLKLIGHYADEAANNADNQKDAAALRVLAHECATGKGKTMRAWSELVTIANYCTGRGANGTRHDFSGKHALSMGEYWEQLSGEIVKNF